MLKKINELITKVTDFLPGSSKSNCAGTYRVFMVTVLLIVVYFPILRMIFGDLFGHRDKMNQVLFELPIIGKVSGWPLSHFVLFFFLGILFPDCDLLVLTAGVLWEIWEEFFGRYILKDRTNTPSYMSETGGRPDIQYTRWWSGSVKDIGFNIAGYYFGKLIARAFDLKIEIPYINKNV